MGLNCLNGAHDHGWHHLHDGHDHVHAQKSGRDCDGGDASGYALANHVYDCVHGDGRAHGYGCVGEGVFLGSYVVSPVVEIVGCLSNLWMEAIQ